MEPLPCLRQVELIRLSRDIPHTSYSELCDAMGYSYTWNQSILATHRGNYIEAVTEILIKWNTEQAETSQSRSILARKLHDVELGGLGTKLSKGEYLPKQQDPHDQEATPLQSSSDIYNEKISESMTVQQCRDMLKNKYINQLCKIQMKPWDQSDYAEFEDMHTDVTIVKKDADGKDTKKKELLQVSEIFSTKVNGRLPARILISAPAGRGKTTAVAKIAYEWVQRKSGSALEHLPLLFVVKFRNTSQLTSIGEAIKSQLLSDVEDLTPENLEIFIRKNQGICHIILDGLDEYAGISSSKRSSVSNIVGVMRWEKFPKCRVLVTSRPHLDNFFEQDDLPRVYTKMWIEGFSRESSREYIDKFFASNLCSGQGLKDYLDEQPLIVELVKTPLFCLMICHLWSEGLLDNGTTTQTELLDRVNVFLMHYANARSKSRVKITLKKLKEIISQLGQVALTGLLDDANKIVFTPCDFQRVPAILDSACQLGIVSKTTVSSTRLPQSNETSSTTIEFYHKLAQEHSAGKFLADQTKHFLLSLKISKLDRVLLKIKANISDYENLIRFAAGTDNSLCMRIMEALLSNSFLDESERYRILLDCSSETTGAEGNLSLVRRCVTSRSMVLKSPTVYTVVGMKNLPTQLKREIRTVQFEGSTLTNDVTNGVWSCLGSFSMLHTLTVSDSSISFPPYLPELPSFTKLSAERMTTLCYERMLSSIPGLREIDVYIDVAELEISNTFQITTASRPMGRPRARDEQFFVHIRLHASPSLTTDRKIDSGESIGGLSVLFEDQTKNQHRLHVSGAKGRNEEALVDLFVKTKQLTSLNSKSGGGSLDNDRYAVQNTRLEIQQCQLSTETTNRLWSSLTSFTSLNHLSISDSSLSFPLSPPELPSVTKLSAERVTSQSYEGVLSSVPSVREIDVSIDVAETSHTRACDEQFFVHIRLHAWPALTTDRKIDSGESVGGLSLLFEDQTKIQQRLHVSGAKGRNEEALVDLFVKTKQQTSLNSGSGGGSLNNDRYTIQNTRLEIQQCHLSTEMTERLWSSLTSFTPLNQLSISDSSLSFLPSPPELPSVKKLSAERVTTHSYEDLLSSLPGLGDIDITIDDAERDIPQITAGLRQTGRHQLTHITITVAPSLPSEKNSVSRETMRELGLMIREQTKNLQRLCLSGMNSLDEEDLVDLVESSAYLKSLDSLHLQSLDCWSFDCDIHSDVQIKKCQLSTEMTTRMWSCLRSYTSLKHLAISGSSLSFPPSHPELPSVIKLSVKRVTSQSCEGLLLSLSGLRYIDIFIDDVERDIRQMTDSLRRTGGQQLTHITIIATRSLPPEKKSVSRETMRGLSLLIREQTKNLQWLCMSRVKCRDEEDLVELVESCGHVKTLSHLMLLDCGTNTDGKIGLYTSGLLKSKNLPRVIALHDDGQLFVEKCQLSSEMTGRMWSCFRSSTSLNHLTISDSSLHFPPSPPELPSVTNLSAERVTSQSYEGLLSSLPGLRDIDITIDDAERELPQITTGLLRTGGQQLTHISLTAPSSLPSQKKSVSRDTMTGLGLLIREQTKNLQWLCLSRVKCGKEEDLVELVESCRYNKTMNHLMLLGCGTNADGRLSLHITRLHKANTSLRVIALHDDGQLFVEKCQLSSEMTARMWTCLRSFTSLNHFTISDSSLRFPPSSPELPSVANLSAERVTPQSYDGLLASLPGLRDIDITIDDAERDIPQITAGLCRTRVQQLTHIDLKAPSSLPSEKTSVSRETMRGLGLLIKKNQNLDWLALSRVKCTDEEGLIYLIDCCRLVTTLSYVWLDNCGTRVGGRLESHLTAHRAPRGLSVNVYHDGILDEKHYRISHIG